MDLRLLILNLKRLNTFLAPKHFKLEDRKTVCSLMCSEDFMATIDLTESYHLISIHSTDRK